MIWQKIRKRNSDTRRDEDKSQNITLNAADNFQHDIVFPNPNAGKIKIITDEPTLKDAPDFDTYSRQLADIIRYSTPRT